MFVYSLFFTPMFVHGGMMGAAAVRGLEIPRGFQQRLIVLLAPHRHGTKPSWR